MVYRSTTLSRMLEFCARAVDFAEANTPYDRGGYAVGIAAHAVLQVVTERGADDEESWKAIAQQVAAELAGRGRSWEGILEPPMPLDAALEGARVALSWLERQPVNATPGARAEVAYTAGEGWTADGSPRWRAILDLVFREHQPADDEGFGGGIHLIARDYKSAWSAGPDDLRSVQMRGQALLLAIHHPEAEGIAAEIANLRTGHVFRRTWVRMFSGLEGLVDEDGESLQDAARAIDVLIAAAEVRGPDGRRLASPGVRCQGCPYLSKCEAATGYLSGSWDGAPVAERVVAYAVHKAAAASLEAGLREALDGLDPVGGVGFHPVEKRAPKPTALMELATRILPALSDVGASLSVPMVRGLLSRIKPSMSILGDLAKEIAGKGRGKPAEREAMIGELVTVTVRPEWGERPVELVTDPAAERLTSSASAS